MSNEAHRQKSPLPAAGGESTITNTVPPLSPRDADETQRPYLIIIAGTHVGELHKISKHRTVVGRGDTADVWLLDDGVSREHVEIVVEGDRVIVRDLGSTNGTYRNGRRIETDDLVDGDKIAIGATTILKFSYQDGIDEAFEQRLYRSAVRDEMTQALKREYFLERLETEVAFSIRHASPVALILWDIDRFKTVNDRYGHAVGDRVLEATASAVRRIIRREDVFGRYGGEEFALACRATPVADALRTAERLREAIQSAPIAVGTIAIEATASFGVATCPGPAIECAADLVAACDAAMYRAKRAGRNRVEAADVAANLLVLPR